jgi:uncharacterized protein YndB with AHSA1/START domain
MVRLVPIVVGDGQLVEPERAAVDGRKPVRLTHTRIDATIRLRYVRNQMVAIEEVDVGFPDRIERVIDLELPPAEVWPALTTAEGLSAWFSDDVTIDLRPGGAAQMTWTDDHAPVMRIERVEPPFVFGFSWPLDGTTADAVPRTYVEFTLEPHNGGTRLVLVESGFAQLPDHAYGPTYAGHAEGWLRELDELATYLAATTTGL